jgi:membrane-associated phospholipid phosphatase
VSSNQFRLSPDTPYFSLHSDRNAENNRAPALLDTAKRSAFGLELNSRGRGQRRQFFRERFRYDKMRRDFMKHIEIQNRRRFLKTLGKTGAMSLAAGVFGVEPFLQSGAVRAQTFAGRSESHRRAVQCTRLRFEAALANQNATPPDLQHFTNGDERIYANKIANYSKGLPHHGDGTVVVEAYNSLLAALSFRQPEYFNAIPLGGDRKLTNPQAGLAFDLEGADAHSFVQPPPPAFASREQAAEIAENYWMALLRDVPFAQYSANLAAQTAANDLTLFGADFKGAKSPNGQVTPNLLFRGLTPGDKAGPFLSQFFYQSCNFGANKLEQKIQTAVPNLDFMNSFEAGAGNWLDVQRGVAPPFGNAFDPVPRYIRSGRDIAQWVHVDVLFQAYFQAFLVLAGANAPVDDGNPYAANPTQDGFGTFGAPHIATLLCEVSTRALKAVWFQKWFVHRRMRPEVFAARIDRALYHAANYPVHAEILNSLSTDTRLGGFMTAGNALLPQTFPEGSPTHPAYGAGHATVAGACVTILKAWFNEQTKLVDLGLAPVQPTDDGLNLIAYSGSDAGDLTIGGELNKIASNVALGRNIAGVHWRSDATESLKLGEAVAISILRDQKGTYSETFNGFGLTKFDGSTTTI